jgi:hypothetical protein
MPEVKYRHDNIHVTITVDEKGSAHPVQYTYAIPHPVYNVHMLPPPELQREGKPVRWTEIARQNAEHCHLRFDDEIRRANLRARDPRFAAERHEEQQHSPTPEVSVSMMQGFGPLSGSYYNTDEPELQACAVNKDPKQRRPYHAEQYQKGERQQPPHALKSRNPYGSPESRIGSATFLMNLSGLIDLYKNPALAEWIATMDKLFSNKEINVSEAVQTLLVSLLNLAVEQRVPIPDTTPAPGKCMGGGRPR